MGKYGGGIEKWRETLENFSQEVYAGKYKKVNYEAWRNMIKAQSVNIDFELIHAGIIHIYCDEFTTVLSADDHSLGEYLIKLAKETDTMGEYYTTSTSTSSNFNNSNIYATSTGTNGITLNPAYGSPYAQYDYYSNIDPATITNMVDEINKISKKEKEKMNLFTNFDFGSCENDNVRISLYGIAVKNANGVYVAYDEKTGNIFDVDILNFNGKYLYKIPVAIKDVNCGDVVIHNRKPVIVTKIEDGKILAIDPAAGEEKVLLLTHSPFGFDFVIKVVNLLGNFVGTASADAPFGNILPLIALSDGNSADALLPLMLMGNVKEINPLMFYFLMKDNNKGNKDIADILPFMLYANPNGFSLPSFAPAEKESCDRN